MNTVQATRVAKTFLGWFQTEAPAGTELHYVPGKDWVLLRRCPGRPLENGYSFVRKLAEDRYPPADAEKITAAAAQLLS